MLSRLSNLSGERGLEGSGSARSIDLLVVLRCYDALCIDQEDLLERGHQVNMMKDIFSTAEFVIAWLGQPSEDTTLAMDALMNESIKQPTIYEENDLMRSIFRREYWKRMWIVQEVVLAQDVYVLCGSQVVSWHKIDTHLAWANRYSTLISRSTVYPHVHAVFTQRSQWKNRRGGSLNTTLDWLIEAFRQAKCADVRDNEQLYHQVLRHVRHPPRLEKTHDWETFRKISRSTLELPLDDSYRLSDVLYRAIEKDRLLGYPLLRVYLESRANVRRQFLVFLEDDLGRSLDPRAGGHQAIYNYVMLHFSPFPHLDDSEAWRCFEILLKEALAIIEPPVEASEELFIACIDISKLEE